MKYQTNVRRVNHAFFKMVYHLNSNIEHSDLPVIILNADNQVIVAANQKACILFDSEKDEITNKTIQQLLDTDKKLASLDIISLNKTLYSLQHEKKERSRESYIQVTFTELPGDKEQILSTHYSIIAEQLVHQLRSPLSGISGYVEILRDQETSDTKINILGKIDKGLRDTFQLLNRLEEFAQPASANITTFDIDQFTKSMDRFIGHSNMQRVVIEVDEKIQSITSDFYLLGKILKELVLNALQASENLENDMVTVRFKKKGVIEVENSIKGDTYPDFDRLFLPFYTTKARQPGLGLPLCKKYSRKMNLTVTPVPTGKKNVLKFEIGNILVS